MASVKSLVSEELRSRNADAWIITDYENRNPTVVRLLGNVMLTRKIFLVMEPDRQYVLCHSIDEKVLKASRTSSEFELYSYNTWEEMLALEKKLFTYHKALMDFSDNGLLPRVSFADYGSVKYVRDLGIEIVSSENLLQEINAVYDEESYQLQLKACQTTLKIKDEAFSFIREKILHEGKVSEYVVQQFIAARFHEEGMVFDDPPIVAIGKNASNPHYGPTEKTAALIRENDLVLIDMWAKYDHPKAVYADITWMGYVGDFVPEIYEERFRLLKKTIDMDIEFLEQNISKRPVHGFEVDRLGRNFLDSTGYGKYFTHRTGHNIGVDVSPHGPGANIDDYETHDTRLLINGTSFSLEPGIYAPDFGMRSETNIAIHDGKPVCVAGRQETIVPILK